MLQCKFCNVTEEQVLLDKMVSDYYECEECLSLVCHMCVETSIITGKDYCQYCRRNLQYIGKWK